MILVGTHHETLDIVLLGHRDELIDHAAHEPPPDSRGDGHDHLGVLERLPEAAAHLRPENCTLPPGLKSLQRQFTGDPGLVMAGAIVAAVPVLILYLVLQRYIVQSVASTGIKG